MTPEATEDMRLPAMPSQSTFCVALAAPIAPSGYGNRWSTC